MNKTQDIHNYQRTLERLIERISEDGEKGEGFSEHNKKIALEFKDDLLSHNISISKTGRYLQDVIWLHRKTNGKPFDEADKKDIKTLVSELNQGNMTEWSRKGIKVFLRKFYKFIRGIDEKGKYPPEVDWFTVNISKSNSQLPDGMLSEEEMSKIIESANCDRDRALISFLCESGCRIGELGSMLIKKVSFEEHGARVSINGKTGPRPILLVRTSPYLLSWINHHPQGDNPEAPLWVGPNMKPLSYARLSNILKNCSLRAGIKRRIYPHLLRHSRATLMAKVVSESTLKNYMGWTQSSNMAATYVHLSGRDSDNAILKMNGIKIPEKSEIPAQKNKKCIRCSRINGFANKFCSECSFPLDPDTANKIIKEDEKKREANALMNKLLQDSQVMELFKKKLTQEVQVQNPHLYV
jgi:integrase/recombinase XerD